MTSGKIMKRVLDNISIKGHSHILKELECQDSSLCFEGQNYLAGIVCDGHGGEKYIRSSFGSKIACEVGKCAIDEFMAKVDLTACNAEDLNKKLGQLELSVIHRWNEKVQAHSSGHPLEGDERFDALSNKEKQDIISDPVQAYGSTFVAAVYFKTGCFILKLGDGNVNLLYKDGTIEEPEELKDDRLQFNFTTSLCSSRASLDFRHCIRLSIQEYDLIGAILTTDGIINCYKTKEAYLSLINNIQLAYLEYEEDKAHSDLEECLNILSQKGSGDDLSVVILREKTDIPQAH